MAVTTLYHPWEDVEWSDDDLLVVRALTFRFGYRVERWHNMQTVGYRYGLARLEQVKSANKGKAVAIGVFDTKEELVAMCKLIYAGLENSDDG